MMTSAYQQAAAAQKGVKSAANQSVRPYSTNQQYMYAMMEDLAEWLKGLYGVNIGVDNFIKVLETGTLLCQHANNITACARDTKTKQPELNLKNIPTAILTYKERNVEARSFFARDNIASFISYCADELLIPDIIRFETNDLVLRHNEKNVVLCLLEVARKGSKYGVPAPLLVQMEEDIDAEIEMEKEESSEDEDASPEPPPPRRPIKQRVDCDFKSLDEMVQYVLQLCTCPTQFPMVRVGEGKYKVGNSRNCIFMRILRQHVMVRVGGGWDTLEHYLDKHDPCRCVRHRGTTDNRRPPSPRLNRPSSTTNATRQKRQSQTTTTPTERITYNNNNNNHTTATNGNRTSRSSNVTPRYQQKRSASAAPPPKSSTIHNNNNNNRSNDVTKKRDTRTARPSSVTRQQQRSSLTSTAPERNSINKNNNTNNKNNNSNRTTQQRQASATRPSSRSSMSGSAPSNGKITYNLSASASATDDVFRRLSQTTTTRMTRASSMNIATNQPISNEEMFKNDLVHIQRDRTGAHQVHRQSESAVTATSRPSELQFSRQRSSDISTRGGRQTVAGGEHHMRAPETRSTRTGRSPTLKKPATRQTVGARPNNNNSNNSSSNNNSNNNKSFDSSGAPRIQLTPTLRRKFNTNLEKNYAQRSQSVERSGDLSPGSPEVFTTAAKKSPSSHVPVIKGSVTPSTPRTNPFFPSPKDETKGSHPRFGFFGVSYNSSKDGAPRSPKSSVSSSSSSKEEPVASCIKVEEEESDPPKEQDTTPKTPPGSSVNGEGAGAESSISSGSSLEEQEKAVVTLHKAITKQNAIDGDHEFDDDQIKIKIPPTNGRSAVIFEEEDLEEGQEQDPKNEDLIMKTDDYVKQVFDPSHESEILDSLERECLENLASLQMTWKSCSTDDMDAIKDIYSS